MMTGLAPAGHGVVANGWYERESAEVRFWRQSNRLVAGEKVWETARRRDPSFTCANLFWWFNMYSSVDVAVTPRPMYTADGRKIPDLWTNPPGLRDDLQRDCGRFPLFKFWGPGAGIESSEWIGRCARMVEDRFTPTLSLIYLPHLDYALQRLGPADPAIEAEAAAIDNLVGGLVEFLRSRGVTPIVLSEYGVTSVSRPIAVNRALREAGLLAVRDELGRDKLDAGASRAFAVADHQIAHVYVNDSAVLDATRETVTALPGVERVLDEAGQRSIGLAHARAGDLVLISEADAWCTYDYWVDDARAPDYARTVDIHRKPGYDPRELFIDPAIRWPRARVAWTLLRKRLGSRALLDVIPLDATLVRGSHGRVTDAPDDGPMILSPEPGVVEEDAVDAAAVREIILWALFRG